jgi:1,4-alpha-glucan branching enzyme
VSDGRLLAIDQLRSTVAALSDSWQREAATATFFEEHALPVVEGDIATFAVLAEADSVYLRHRINIWPDDLDLTWIPGTDLWFLTIKLERGARIEYQFEIVRDGQSWRFNDPYNPRQARSPFGDCSVCHGPGYTVPDWASFRTETDPGSLLELEVQSGSRP